nr:hypothetical protein [Rhodocyclus purpureus]
MPLCEALMVPKRSLERWRRWWQQDFVKTPRWILGQARFMPTIDPREFPCGLLERFQGDDLSGRLMHCFRFLATDWQLRRDHLA